MRSLISSSILGVRARVNVRKVTHCGLLLSLIFQLRAVQAQTVFMDNFDDGNDTSTPPGWIHYAPLTNAPFNSEAIWTFPNDDGGKAYRMFGGAPNIR